MVRPVTIELAGKDQRPKFDRQVQGFRANEWGAVEERIVGNGQIVGGDAAGQDSQLQVADFHFPAERLAEIGLQHRPKVIRVEPQRKGDDGQQQHGHNNCEPTKDALHMVLLYECIP